MLANSLQLGIDLDDTKTLLQETKTLAALAEIFQGEDITFQFPVGPYRVDMYLPAYNIVVECDEHGHCQYNKKHEETRAQYIEDAIGCRFVRFDPDGNYYHTTAIIVSVSIFSKQPIRSVLFLLSLCKVLLLLLLLPLCRTYG